MLALLSSCSKGKPNAFDRAGYHVREGVVWYLPSWTSEPFVVKDADVASLKFPLPKGTDQDFARDATHVFLSGKTIPGADPATFEIFDHRFSRDARNVYLGHDVFCGDPAHFSRVSGNFVKNGHSVYLITQAGRGEVVSKDPANFSELSGADSYSFCADRAQVFVNGNPIEGAQPASFKVLDGGYTRDAARTYYFDKPMPDGTDADTLQPLAGGYAKDRGRVYYLGKVLAGADAATFEITDPKWPKAKDKNRAWEQGSAVPGGKSE
ncbi:hypothetical protein AYO49_04980 [Verrucomicrobiaceae bacterium SCGC AG-212-N21]|nr:hypothetical protein AYO49_04980 [Verrucomicrobiaceae bacterium SCGC AG-212-N21]